MKPKVQRVSRAVSLYVRHWQERQKEVKEESLTDWLLDNLSRRVPEISYHAFTRHEEARVTGADWEWWFAFKTFSFKIRVQAKKLSPSADHYPSIAYSNDYGLQIEKLLSDASNKNFAPFYALYVAESHSSQCRKNILDEGVYLARATRIFAEHITPGRKPITTADLLQKATPLSCFFSCPYTAKPDGFLRFIAAYFPEEPQDLTEAMLSTNIRGGVGYHEDLPKHIKSLMQSEEGMPSWWQQEHSAEIEGLQGIIIVNRIDAG